MREKALRAVVGALALGPESPEVQTVTEGILHLFGEPTALDAIDPANARSELTRSVMAFVVGLAHQGPLILSVSDIHWADPLVLELLDRLVVELGSQAFTLLTSARPWEGHLRGFELGRHNAVLLRLDPLDAAAAAELVRTLLGGEVDEEVEDELLDRSGGNPLFLEELATMVQASGAVGGLPDTLRGLVAARLDELSLEERNMVENAAILGPSGTWKGLQEFARALGQTCRREVLNAPRGPRAARRGRRRVGVPLGVGPGGGLQHADQGGPGAAPRRRGRRHRAVGRRGRGRRHRPPLRARPLASSTSWGVCQACRPTSTTEPCGG